MKDRITRVLEHFFITEPAMFQVLCTHELRENTEMKCPVRCGRRRVEYNPDFLREMSDQGLEEALRTEACRILLKHPYERKIAGCSQQAMAVGSNVVIGDNYRYGAFQIERPADYDLEEGMSYEWYSRKIQDLLPPGGGDGDCGDDNKATESRGGSADSGGLGDKLGKNAGRNRDLSELWDEDELEMELINGIIEGCQDWGSLAGSFAEQLKASTRAKINWRNVLSGFRASIISTKKRLTRMKPNRRYGFDQMGSRREYDTRLLIAVDVSGSISSENLSYFYGIVNSAFRHVASVDVIQFDCGVRVVQNLKKIIHDVLVIGRGGTSFDEPIQYAHENEYDGLIMLTDGYAPEPVIPDNMRCNILWVCQDNESYQQHHSWMEKSGKVCTIELK